LREYHPRLRIVAVEPQPKHQQQGLRNMETSRIPPILDWRLIDERMVVMDEDAFRMARRLCQGTIVAVLPDRGEKYLTTTLFE
jgi:cysteine synthase